MGAQKSKTSDIPPQLQMSEAQVKHLLDTQRKEYERKHQEKAFIAAHRKLKEVANTAAELRKNQNEIIIAAQRKLQEEAASIAAQRKFQEEAFITAQRKLQEEAAILAAQRKLQEETFIAAQRKLLEEAAKAATQRKLQEEALIAAQRKCQEEAFFTAQKKLQEEAAIAVQIKLLEEADKRNDRVEAIKRAILEEATKKKQQEEAAKRALQEEATKKKQQEEAAKFKFFIAKRACQEEAPERKQQEEAAKFKFFIAKRACQEEAPERKQKEEDGKEAFQVFLERTLSKFQEEVAKKTQQVEAAKKALHEEVTKRKQQEEATKRAFQEEAAKKKQQEEATKRAFQEEATKKKQQEEPTKRAFQEEAAKKKQQEEATKRAFQEEGATRYLKAPVPVPHREPFPRSSSVSRPRELPREADVLRYCSTCYSRSIKKMFECENGHGSCNDCKIKGRACGICRSDLTNRRSYDIENKVAQTIVPCPHAWQGCVLHIKIADMGNHVQECPFKEQVCPLAAVFGSCRWLGKIRELSSHFADMHPYFLHTNVDSEFHVRNIHRDYRYICFIELGYHFIFHQKISKNDKKVYMAVQLIGTKISAKKWGYEIHVYNKSENRRKYIYTDNCRSSIDDMDEVFRSGECAVLPMWYANTFVNNEALTFKLFIKSTYENRKDFDGNQRGRDYFEEEEEDNGWSGSCTSLTDERDIRQQPRGWENSRHGRRNY